MTCKNNFSLKINPARRCIAASNSLGAIISASADKIKSGYGNGDCILIDLRNKVFAVSDAAERHPEASRVLLKSLALRLNQSGLPTAKERFKELIDDVYSAQNYNLKATLSCVAIKITGKTATAFIANGGDGSIFVRKSETDRFACVTKADMCFAGRSKHIGKVFELPLDGDDCAIAIATDGIADVARLANKTSEEILEWSPKNDSPAKFVNNLLDDFRNRDTKKVCDDFGVVFFEPRKIGNEKVTRIILGGTTPVEEQTYRHRVSKKEIPDRWISDRELSNLNIAVICDDIILCEF